MEKQKQIEEMAKYCCNCCEMGWGCDFGDCNEKGEGGYKECKLAKETAEMLYNAGYRKIPEGAVVVSEQVWEEHIVNWDKTIKAVEERVRKEMAEKFANEVYKELYQLGKIYALPETLDADKYGIFSLTQEVVAKIAKEQFFVEIKE